MKTGVWIRSGKYEYFSFIFHCKVGARVRAWVGELGLGSSGWVLGLGGAGAWAGGFRVGAWEELGLGGGAWAGEFGLGELGPGQGSGLGRSWGLGARVGHLT